MGGPTSLKERPPCCAGSSPPRTWRPYSRAPSPPRWAWSMASGPHCRRNNLAQMRPPASAGGPTPLKERPRCCAGRSQPRHMCPYSRAPSPPCWAWSTASGPHCRSHNLAQTSPPGSAGGTPPLKEKCLAQLQRGEFSTQALAPVCMGAISPHWESIPPIGPHLLRHCLALMRPPG